jgi:hypothetical protein
LLKSAHISRAYYILSNLNSMFCFVFIKEGGDGCCFIGIGFETSKLADKQGRSTEDSRFGAWSDVLGSTKSSLLSSGGH